MIDIENDDYVMIYNLQVYKPYYPINEILCQIFNIKYLKNELRTDTYNMLYFKNRIDYILWKLKNNITFYVFEYQEIFNKENYNMTWRILEND